MNVPMAKAKAKFSELVNRAEAGEEVSLTRHGKIVARLMPPAEPVLKPSIVGLMKDAEIWMSDDFDEPLEDFKDYM